MMLRNALIGCGLGASLTASAAAETVVVNVFDFEFSVNAPGDPIVDPVIQLGDTVQWVLISGIHSTTSVSGQAESWDSGVSSSPGVLFERTFTNLGEFGYYCIVHGSEHDGMPMGMAGFITVVPGPGAAGLLGLAGVAALRRRR